MKKQKETTCRNCGGQTIISEFKPSTKNASFDHIVLKCRTCGTWCGGVTKPRKREQ